MGKPVIVHFKRWYQIQVDGYTIHQTLCHEEAIGMLEELKNSMFPASRCGIDINHTPRRAQTLKRITIYP